MKVQYIPLSFVACVVLTGCAGFVVRSLTVEPGSRLVATRPTLSYNLKRSRYDVKVELKIARVTTWRKNSADEWVADRANATYRLSAEPKAATVTHVFEDDPYLEFAIHLDAMESMATTTKKFEIKFDPSTNSLTTINADFEDTTLKVVENVVSIASDVVKFAAGVTLGSKSTSPTVRIEEELLDKPVIAFEASVLVRDAELARDAEQKPESPTPPKGFRKVIADEKTLLSRVSDAQGKIRELHKTLNAALFEQEKEKLLAAEKDAGNRKAIEDAKAIDALINAGASQSAFYPEDVAKVVIDSTTVPKTIEALIYPDIPVSPNAKEATEAFTERSKLTAEQIGGVVAPTKAGDQKSSKIPGVFFRRPGRALVTVQATFGASGPSVAFVSQRMDLAEAGRVEFARVDTRLFTNRTIGLKFGANGMLNEYALTATGGAEALSKAVADGVNKGLVTAEAVKKQRKEDADATKKEATDAEAKAKKEVQDAANLATRIRAKEGQIFDKKQLIFAQQRTFRLKGDAVKKAKDELDRLIKLVPAQEPAESATDAEKNAYVSKKNAANAAEVALASASDAEFTAEQTLPKLQYELDILEKELEIVKTGLTVSTGG